MMNALRRCEQPGLGRLRLGALALAMLTAGSLRAQEALDTTGTRVGVFGAYQLVQQQATIIGIPGIPTCSPGFSSGNGSGFAAGVLGQWRSSSAFALQARLGYSTGTTTLRVQENIGNALENGEVVIATTEHRLKTTLGLIDLEPRLLVRPFSFPVSLNLGVQCGIVSSFTYDQEEAIISPTNVRFTGGLVRNHYSGKVPDAPSVQFSGLVGLSYELPLSAKVSLSPEVTYYRSFSQLVQDSNWYAHGLRIGFSMTYTLNSEHTFADSTGPSKMLSATVAAVKLSDDEQSGAQMSKMHVEEFVAPQLRPLLNFMFFDEGSADIPSRYDRLTPQDAASFDMNRLQNLEVLPTYYQMLNVIGLRMQKNPAATLTLIGCNADAGEERGKVDLSRKRAESVRNYLRDVWKIGEDRLKVEARGLPEKPSGSTPDGMEENRRVEIRSSTPDILEPVFVVDTALTTDPAAVRFITEVASEVGVEQWKLVASQGDHELKTFAGNGSVPHTLDWGLQSERASIPRGSQKVNYRLEVTDSVKNRFVTPMGSIGVEQMTVKKKREEGLADKEINKFSLILFEYGKSEISDANRRIVEFIRQKIDPNAKVLVTGHTDRAGDAAVNQRLSEERARSTARALGVPNADVKGLGESILLYNNDLPEGRFYCRVVNVVVETQIGQ
ncbi:MAG TPA: OmpA family protein [Candidatus Kapabacteria bacterium]|nr:OmpA family protein [Candidatus Kapabacteria bacterium]